MLSLKRKYEKNSFKYARIRIDQIKATGGYTTGADSEIEMLAKSMKTCGMLQPLIVRSNGNGYELIAGERRYKAAMLAGFRYVDVMIIRAKSQNSLIISMAERLSESLNFFDQARILRDAAAVGLTYRKISDATGLPPSTIADKIRLLQLEPSLRERIIKERLTEEQAKKLLEYPPESRMERLERMLAPPKEPAPKLSGFVRNGSILTRPIVQALEGIEKTGIKCCLVISEEPETVRLDITIHKKL